MSLQGLHRGRPRLFRSLAVLDELAVAAIADPSLGRPVPEVARRRPGHGESPLRRIGHAAVAPVRQRPGALDEIGGVGTHRPFVSIGADFAVHVEIVQEHELARQRVVIGRHALGEKAKLRLAVALGNVAENLVVGAVLLDDVDDVLDRRRVADAAREWDVPRRASLPCTAVGSP